MGKSVQSGPRGVVSVWGIIVLSLVVQLALAKLFPNILWPDEIFQTVEQAHRIVFGYGVVPWEFQPDFGIRNWVFPGLLTVPMWASKMIHADGTSYILFVQIIMAMISLSPNIVLVRILRHESTDWRIVACGLLFFNFWFELLYFGPKPLIDTVGTAALLLGLGYAHLSIDEDRQRDAVWAIAFLTLASSLRVQLAPAAAPLGLFLILMAGSWQRQRMLLITATAIIAVFGAVDWLTWGVPFQSWVQYVHLNLVAGVADRFGTAPWYSYLRYYWDSWGAALVLFLPIIWLDFRRNLVFMIPALLAFLTMSLIGHKEIRFIYPVSMILLMMAAINFVRYAKRLNIPKKWLVIYACSFVLFSTIHGQRLPFWKNKSDYIRVYEALREFPDLCGLVHHDNVVVHYPGYYYLHRQVPIVSLTPERYAPGRDALLGHVEQGNYHMSNRDLTSERGFARVTCSGDMCLYKSNSKCHES